MWEFAFAIFLEGLQMTIAAVLVRILFNSRYVFLNDINTAPVNRVKVNQICFGYICGTFLYC